MIARSHARCRAEKKYIVEGWISNKTVTEVWILKLEAQLKNYPIRKILWTQ